jgi:hypothetical protein
MSDFKKVLEDLGYNLKDCGAYWQTTAVYRGGDNPQAIQIYKDSGVWKDFVEDSLYLPFQALVQKTLGTNDPIQLKAYLKNTNSVIKGERQPHKQLLREEKSYPISCVERLLPQYDLYQKINKKISEKTLRVYKGGLATQGKMYRRFVFPIVRSDGRVHGFTGRKTLSEFEGPKWLITGKKNTFFYPYYVDDSISQAIAENKSVHIVESVGDSLSLYEEGIKNNLVSFGVSMSPKFISRLSALDLKRIYISYNNDFDSKNNVGFEGAVKSVFKLIDVVDFQTVFFVPPHENDFGVMPPEDIQLYHTRCKNYDHKASCEALIEIAESMDAEFRKKNANKSFGSSLLKFKKQYKFHYE